MVNHNWWTSLLLFIWCLAAHLCIADGQSENAIGAHRVYEKTSFSCAGRPSGYYADIETGCQVYHMCDGLGRQFSYSCPNTTLFQQRMLICDHWYMVNCSKAESDYTANLLIGQRDKPFVNDEENSQRTPRPDLLDRPYAPDYSGESFRNQYKQLPPAQNQIVDNDKTLKNADKITASSQLTPGQQRWKIPSRDILPPAFEAQIETDERNTENVHFIAPPIARPATTKYSIDSTTPTPLNRRLTAPTISSKRGQFHRNTGAEHQRPQLVSEEHDDLGTSHSTRYNTSADFNSAEERRPPKSGSANSRKFYTNFNNAVTNNTKSKISNFKVPSRTYEPPFIFPIYNQNDTISTEKSVRFSTAAPFTLSTATRSKTTTTTTTTRPTTLAGKPFTSSGFSTTTTVASLPLSFDVPTREGRTPTPAQGFKPPTPRPEVLASSSFKPSSANSDDEEELELSALDYKIPSSSRLKIPTPFIDSTSTTATSLFNKYPELPANDLLPPYKDFIQHDIATTQGPPIYYEWKAPSNGLEPPKLDAPIGTEGREYTDSVIDYNSISAAGGFTRISSSTTSTFGIDQQKSSATITKNTYANNPFLATKTQRSIDESTSKTPTQRSIKDTAQPENNSIQSTKAAANTATSPTDTADLTHIREELSVPEFLFPLENIGRTGYASSDTYNSFQLKIPERRSDNDAEHLHWFGENPKCPECHPSYVKPGTCEPCIRR